MYSMLFEHLKRPPLYERTTERFWNDPHISAQMLKAHLNPAIDAASRKPEFIDRCAGWVASLLPEGASLMDIGCGPGLYTKRFSEHGLLVTGLDFSESSISYAREHDSGSEYIVQDYLSMTYANAFDMITLIYFDYGALIPEERRDLLCRVYRALKPGGLFLFDVLTPQKGAGKRDSTSWQWNPNGGFWSANPHICLNATSYFDDVAEARRTVLVEENGVRCFNIWDCYFTQQSLLDEVTPFNFIANGFYSDASGQLYRDGAEAFCVILKKEIN